MTKNELNELSNERIELARSFFPLEKTLDGDNLKIYENLPHENKLRSLNLEIISKLDNFNDVYISAVYDSKSDEIIIFYHVHRKNFNNYTSYKKISKTEAKRSLYKTIFVLLKKHNADPKIIEEKIIFE